MTKRRRAMARPIQPAPTRRSPDRRLIALSVLAVFAVALVAIWALLPRDPGRPSPTSGPSAVLPRQTVVLSTSLPGASPSETRAPGATSTPPTGPTQTGERQTAGPATAEPQTSTPLPPGAGLGVNWVEADSPGLGVIQNVIGAASGNGRVVVIGDATEDFLPGIWSSTDGRTWQPGNFPDAQSPDLGMTGVAASATGFVAFAQNYDTGNAVAYASSDGQTWTRSDDPDFVEDGVLLLDSVGSTFVAATDGGVLLTSTDGVEWNPIGDANAAVVAAGVLDFASYNGVLYAFVIDYSAPEDAQPAGLWSTQDGAAWNRIGNIAGTEGVVDVSGAVGPKGMVVLSQVDQGDFFGWKAWQSVDGTNWQPAANTPTEITDVIADQAGFIAVGSYNLAGGCAIDETENVGTTWTSVDGLKWRQLSDEGWVARQIQALGVSGRTLIGVGIDWNLIYSEPVGDSGRAWTADLPEAASDDAPAPAPTPEPTPLVDCGD
jgi:hypothetical protein